MHDERLRRCIGMQVVGLELFRRDVCQHERKQRGIVLPRQFWVERMELRGVIRAVVRREPDAKQQDTGICLLHLPDDLAQVLFYFSDAGPAQSVVRPQFQDHQGRMIFLYGLADAAQPARSRLAADTCIHHGELRVTFFQLKLQ